MRIWGGRVSRVGIHRFLFWVLLCRNRMASPNSCRILKMCKLREFPRKVPSNPLTLQSNRRHLFTMVSFKITSEELKFKMRGNRVSGRLLAVARTLLVKTKDLFLYRKRHKKRHYFLDRVIRKWKIRISKTLCPKASTSSPKCQALRPPDSTVLTNMKTTSKSKNSLLLRAVKCLKNSTWAQVSRTPSSFRLRTSALIPQSKIHTAMIQIIIRRKKNLKDHIQTQRPIRQVWKEVSNKWMVKKCLHLHLDQTWIQKTT